MRHKFLQRTLVSFFLSFGQSIFAKPLSPWEWKQCPPYLPLPPPLQDLEVGVCSTHFCWMNKWTWSICTISGLFVLKITSCFLCLACSATEWKLSSLRYLLPGCPPLGECLPPDCHFRLSHSVDMHHPTPGLLMAPPVDALPPGLVRHAFLGRGCLLALPQLMALGWIVWETKWKKLEEKKKRK